MRNSRGLKLWIAGIVVLLGTTATAPALWQQWDNGHGKPFVFGFDAAGTYFLMSLCFLIIALLTAGRLTLRRTALLSSLIFLPAAVLAASFVRFTFIALAGALCLATILSEAKQRKHVVAVNPAQIIAAQEPGGGVEDGGLAAIFFRDDPNARVVARNVAHDF